MISGVDFFRYFVTIMKAIKHRYYNFVKWILFDHMLWILYAFLFLPQKTCIQWWLTLCFLLVVGPSGCYLREIQSLSHQECNRMYSCGNHIMSCEIMIFNETPLSAVQMRVWHPPEQAETFPDWLSHLYWSSVSFNP